MEKSLGGHPSFIHFNRGNLTIQEVSKALKLDKQTVRVLLQNNAVSWGQAVKKPGSAHYIYLISPRRFYEETGVLLGAELDEYQLWNELQGRYSTDENFFRYAEKQKQAADEKKDMKREGRYGI